MVYSPPPLTPSCHLENEYPLEARMATTGHLLHQISLKNIFGLHGNNFKSKKIHSNVKLPEFFKNNVFI